jgi:hypothetical protein
MGRSLLKMKKGILIFLFIACVFLPQLYAQLAFDTLLFTIKLNDDSTRPSLFYCYEEGRIKQNLSGPVTMQDDNLLFYSENGYVLYNQRGQLLDSHSVYRKNRGLAGDHPKRIKVAFPIDGSTIIYYQKVKRGDLPVTIFEKKLFKNRPKLLNEDYYKYYPNLDEKQLFNLAFNSITDDMMFRYQAVPQLVGFTSLDVGNKWWSIDRFYNFTSPVINRENGHYSSFFPGIKVGKNKKKLQFVEPVQVYRWENTWYYSGVYASIGTTEDKYFQTFFVFDNAGNIIYADELLKLENRDAIIGEDRRTYYTTKKIKKFVFQPVINMKGDIFYGIINYVDKSIDVRQRKYYCYKAYRTEPNLAHLIDDEKCIEYKPVSLECNTKTTGGKTIPNVNLLDSKGKFVKAQARHLTKEGYICRISRIPYRDIEKKLIRNRAGLSKRIVALMDSLSNISTVACPYSLSISGPKGMVRNFNYPPGESVLCARILELQKSGNLLVRVDCINFAEILIFETDWTFVNRFVFNRQNYKDRRDLVVAANNSPIIELDYESEPVNGNYYKWERRVVR